ncbi:hypothetical protein [Paenibacillus tepidiphilus]|uniref:hypothetical protein n=1 Tax=Paenibacillus tepidiphilus TaxID=2608683 RepID=UPI00123AC542|nr:hypothetical protein [Paenibacillus tepidiphilus]
MHTDLEQDQVRVTGTSFFKRIMVPVITAVIIGILMGWAAKLVDRPGITPFFDDLGGRLGIWVFTAALLAVFSYSPKLAAVRVFAFFASMLTVYYLYTTLVLDFFPAREILFWGICSAVSPVCGYLMWYARGGGGWFAPVVSALPITVLLAEGFELRHAYLPVHYHYYLIPWLMAVYLLMAAALLLIIPKRKTQSLIVLPIALLLALIMISLDLLGALFGGMNGVL